MTYKTQVQYNSGVFYFPLSNTNDSLSGSAIPFKSTIYEDDYPTFDIARSQSFVYSADSYIDVSGFGNYLAGRTRTSILLWVKLDGGHNQPLFTFAQDSDNYIECFITSSSRLNYRVIKDGEIATDVSFCLVDSPLTNNDWRFISFVAEYDVLTIHIDSVKQYTWSHDIAMFSELSDINTIVLGKGLYLSDGEWFSGNMAHFSAHITNISDYNIENKFYTYKINKDPIASIYSTSISKEPTLYFVFDDNLESLKRYSIFEKEYDIGTSELVTSESVIKDGRKSILLDNLEYLKNYDLDTTIFDAAWTTVFNVRYHEYDDNVVFSLNSSDLGIPSILIQVIDKDITCNLRLSDNSVITLEGIGVISKDINYNVAITFTGSNYYIYVGGVEKSIVSSALSIKSSSGIAYIGAFEDATGLNIHPKLSVGSYAFYNSFLSENAVKEFNTINESYEEVIAKDFPIAYYRMDEAY